jgi:hypothetical protein
MSSAPGLAVLEPRRTILVTQVEDHQDILAPHAPVDSERRDVLVELAFCTVSAGMYAGSRGIEVRLDGYRVGELTPTMSHRYAELLEQVYAAGQQPGAEAVVKHGPRGVEMQLRLPALDESEEPTRMTPVVEPLTSHVDDLPQQDQGPDFGFVPAQQADGTWLQQDPWREPETVAAAGYAGPYEPGYDASYDDRAGAVAPAPRRFERRRLGRSAWIAAGAVAAVLIGVVVLVTSGGGDEPTSFSASTTLPDRATPATTAPAPTTTTAAPAETTQAEAAATTRRRAAGQLTLTVAPAPRAPVNPTPAPVTPAPAGGLFPGAGETGGTGETGGPGGTEETAGGAGGTSTTPTDCPDTTTGGGASQSPGLIQTQPNCTSAAN